MKKKSCIHINLCSNDNKWNWNWVFFDSVVNDDTEETMVQSSVVTESAQLQSTGNSDSPTTITAYSIWVLPLT